MFSGLRCGQSSLNQCSPQHDGLNQCHRAIIDNAGRFEEGEEMKVDSPFEDKVRDSHKKLKLIEVVQMVRKLSNGA